MDRVFNQVDVFTGNAFHNETLLKLTAQLLLTNDLTEKS